MKIRKKTLALLLFSVAFMCSLSVSAFVLWQTDALRLQDNQPAVSTNIAKALYPVADEQGLWGYIDEQGAWQIEPAFEQAEMFLGKAAWVKQGGLWGAVGIGGEILVQPEYRRIAVYVDGNNRFVAAFDSVLSSQATTSALYDINGQKLFGLSGELREPSSGLMAFSRSKGETQTWGYINPHGEIVIEPVYAKVGQAAGNYALVKEESGQTLLLNIYAKTGVSFEAADDLNAVGSRLVSVYDENSGHWGYMDVDGNMQIDYSFAEAEAFRGGAAAAKGDSGLWGLLTPDGVWAVEPEFAAVCYLDNGIYAMQLVGGVGWQLVNALGDALIDEVVYRFDDWQNGLLACYVADKTLFIDSDGKLLDELTVELVPGAVWCGELWGTITEHGATWYDKQGEVVYAEKCALLDDLTMTVSLENSTAAYMVSYPTVAAADGEKLSAQWQRLNSTLKELALDEYDDAFADIDEDLDDIGFVVGGDFELLQQGRVMTVCQKLTLDSGRSDDENAETVLHTVCFDMSSGRQYRLADLFADNVNWRSSLGEPLTVCYELQCVARGEAMQVEVIELLAKRLARNQDFACTADGLVFYFALSDGQTVAIELPYADIDDMLDTDGAMWQALSLVAENQAN